MQIDLYVSTHSSEYRNKKGKRKTEKEEWDNNN